MAESFSVKAVLSAVDRGFSSTFKNCFRALDKINTKVSGLAFGVMAGVGQAAFNTVANGARELVAEIDNSNASWKTFNKNMEMLGKDSAEINKVTKELQQYAQQTVYSSSDMATTFAQLEAVGVKGTLNLVKGFGGLAAAAENPQQAMKTLSTQATQMAAKPTVAWADFKLMLEQTPAGIAAVAKQMGKTTSQLVTDVQDGKVNTQDFFEAIKEVGTNDAFTKLATEAKTIGQAMDGLKETLANKLTPAFDMFSKLGIKAVNGFADKLSSINADKIVNKICVGMVRVRSYIDKAGKYVDVFKNSFSTVVEPAQKAFDAVCGVIANLREEFGQTAPLDTFRGIVDKVAGALNKVFTFISANAGTIQAALSTGISIAIGIWDKFSSSASKVGSAVMDLIGYIVANSDVFMSILGAGVEAIKPYWDALVSVLTFAVGVIKKIATVIVEHADSFKALIPWVLGAVAAFKGFKAVKAALPFVKTFATKLSSMATTLAGGLANKLFGVSTAQDKVGKSSKASSKQLLASAQAFALMAVGVLAIAVGFALLAQSAIALSEAGGLAIGVMAGLVVGVAALGAGLVVVLKTLAPMGKKLMPVATAMLAMGAAVVLVAAGFAILSASAIALANAGTPAIATMFGLIAAVALLAGGAALLAPVLTAGATGLLAFGAAILLCSVGAVLAATSLVILSSCLPTLAEHGTKGAVAILALGGAMIVFGAGAIVAGAGAVVLAAGFVAISAAVIVASAALVALTAGILVLTVGVLALSVGLIALGASLTLVGVAFSLIASTVPIVAASSLVLVAAFTALVAVSLLLTAELLLLNVPLLAISASMLVATASMAAFGVAMTTGAAATLLMATALLAVTAEMSVIAEKALSASKSLKSMRETISVVEEGLNALESKAKNAMNKLKNVFDSTAREAEKSGKNTGNGFAKGMQSGLNKAPAVAASIVSLVASTLNSGASAAYSAGQNISAGFAAGMMSCLGQIQSAAAAMAAAADAAIRAKAKIHSPSKITTALGKYYGEGFANGIASMAKDAWKAAQELVSIPQVATPQLAGMYGYELSSDYDYSRNIEYNVTVVSELDGREVGRGTAAFVEEEINKRQTRTNRKKGKV